MLERNLQSILSNSPKSALLLGPRQTGKTTLIRALSPDLTINFADESVFLDFARNPAELKQRLEGQKLRTIFIDEVQRLPSILNTVQMLIDSYPGRYKFYLTGSSARKLKRGKANRLPGRVLTYQLGTLTTKISLYCCGLFWKIFRPLKNGLRSQNSTSNRCPFL